MDYSVKTLSQLRPVLRGFRTAAGLTQAMLAERLGITQQSYAQFEADPAAAGVERLFKVLRLLNAGITLSQDILDRRTGHGLDSASTPSKFY